MGPNPMLPVTRETIKKKIKEWGDMSVRKRWNNSIGSRQARENIRQQLRRDTEELLNLERRDLRHIIMVLTGHGGLGSHLYKMGVQDSAVCRKCKTEDETPSHFVVHCPVYLRQRFAHLGNIIMHEERWQDIPYGRLSRYIKATGRLSEYLRE